MDEWRNDIFLLLTTNIFEQLLSIIGFIFYSVFNLEYHEFCNKDYIEARHENPGGNLIGRFCGSTFPRNISARDGLWLKFRSDDQVKGQGFVAHFSQSRYYCI